MGAVWFPQFVVRLAFGFLSQTDHERGSQTDHKVNPFTSVPAVRGHRLRGLRCRSVVRVAMAKAVDMHRPCSIGCGGDNSYHYISSLKNWFGDVADLRIRRVHADYNFL